MNNNYRRKIKSYKFGIVGEFIAIVFLVIKGYKIIARRYKTKVGEIDIIASKKDLLIMIEVKSRKYYDEVEEVLSLNQRKRIKNAANFFIQKNYKKFCNHSVRFDLIIVKPFCIPKHFIDFWG